jgi:Tol biopolymer transport system component
MVFDGFLVQGPMTNTLLVRHVGPPQGMIRAPGHIDVLRFAPGQAPTLEEVSDAGPLYGIHWWSPDRATGALYSGYRGGEKVVTVDANGHIVEEHSIPYLQSSAVQPGGEWLAYGTEAGSPNLPFYGSDPTTAYLLNLITGRRLQISSTGKGHVWSWSPDGKWLVMTDETNGKGHAMLSSPDGQARFIIPDPGSYQVWSPDSMHLAFAQTNGHSPDGHVITSWDSEIFIVDIAGKTISKADISGLPRNAPSTLLPAQPQWSPDGSQLGFLALDHIQGASAMYSEREPALYIVSWP